ncbi:MAG: hypothetical protein JXD19_10390, partial [Deltaproteobacteria bacterium]|nr:hypothetical protein [Deltaproteobacteria bacterium]
GTLRAESNYNNGLLNGASKLYYSSGTLHCVDAYENGERVSRQAYDQDGNVTFDTLPDTPSDSGQDIPRDKETTP